MVHTVSDNRGRGTIITRATLLNTSRAASDTFLVSGLVGTLPGMPEGRKGVHGTCNRRLKEPRLALFCGKAF